MLHGMLYDAISKEGQQCWKPFNIRLPTDESLEIHPCQRDEMIEWMLELNYKFHFSPETFVHSVCILDRFLMAVKARPKYLQCIAFSSFFLAAKLKEEDEAVPATVDLVRDSECDCTVAEVLRMERVILDKLKWDINSVTSLQFLQIFHAILVTQQPQLLAPLGQLSPSRHLSILTSRLSRCLTHHEVAIYSGSTLALSLLSLELEVLTPEWLALTIMLQRMLQTDNQELIRCRELITFVLEGHPASNTVYIISPPTKQPKTSSEIKKANNSKPQQQRYIAHEDVMDIADSIKRLYSEDNSSSSSSNSTPAQPQPTTPSWDREMQITPVPPLQAVQVN